MLNNIFIKCLRCHLKQDKQDKGFTLIEVLAAIFVITIGVVGILTLVQRTIAFTQVSSSRLVASYLAQEGIEIIRNIRDTNWLEGNSWDEGLPASSPDYGVDYQTQALPDSSCSSQGYLEFDGNFYSCSFSPDSKFKRKITISKDTDILKVSVLVEWQERGRTHQVTAQENLYQWR